MATRTAKDKAAGKAAPAKTKTVRRRRPRAAAAKAKRRPAAKATAAKTSGSAAAPDAPVRVEPADAGLGAGAACGAGGEGLAAQAGHRRDRGDAAGLRRRRRRPVARGARSGGQGAAPDGAAGGAGRVRAGGRRPRPGRDPRARRRRTGSSSLLPVRHARMLQNAFGFYRGAPAVMAADLGAGLRTELDVQLCGDAHLLNFGVYGSPERSLVFDVNDFDETLPGPFEWDVKRLIASLVVAARQNGFRRQEGARHRPRERARLPDLHAPVRRDGHADDLVHAARTSTASSPASTTRCSARTRRRRPPRRPAATAPRPPPSSARSWTASGRSPAQPPLDRLARRRADRAAARDIERATQDELRHVPALAAPRRQGARRPVPLRRHRAQGGGRRLRRHALLHRRAHRPRRRRRALPAGQGGRPLGARAVPAAQPLQAPGRARRDRAAPHAVGQRHLPRLEPRPRRRRLLLAPAARLEGVGERHDDGRGAPARPTASCAPGRWRRGTRARATRSPSARTWARRTVSTWPWPTSPRAYADQNEADYAALRQAAEDGRIEVAEVF